jgi:2-dehydropantoate 2-reductase
MMRPFYGIGPRFILRDMRYVIYGAGAIGGSLGAKLFAAGREVVLIARGGHLAVLRERGLTLTTPDGDVTQRIPAAGHPSEIEWQDGDVVLLTVKSQDTQGALEDLRSAAGDVPVVCAQNGVANERMALRLFSRVYGMVVVMPSTHLEPGLVLMHSGVPGGMLDPGRYPEGVDATAEAVAADITAAGFICRADPKIMRLKYAKLLTNLMNSVQALCGLEAAAGDIVRGVRAEAIACYEVAGVDCATPEEFSERVREVIGRQAGNAERSGGSTWQSLARGAGSLETDYLNGEIALLGALHGVPTPYNRMLQHTAAEAARLGRKPGSYTVEELLARVGAA